MGKWLKRVFCLHLSWECFDTEVHWYDWGGVGRLHECRECAKQKVFAQGDEPVNFEGGL